MSSSKCQAKDPSKCVYHSSARKAASVQLKIEALFNPQDKKKPSNSVPVYNYDAERDSFYESLTEEQKITLSDWTSSSHGYKIINGRLRFSPRNIDESQKQFIGKMDKILELYHQGKEKSASRVLYRGVENLPLPLNSLTKGTEFSDNGFLSTTDKVSLAKLFTNSHAPTILKIVTDKGVPVGSTHGPQEREYLLPRGSKFKVTKVEKQKTGSPSQVLTVIEVIQL